MLGILVSLLVAQSGFFFDHIADRIVSRIAGRLADRVVTVSVSGQDDEASREAQDEADAEADSDEDADYEALPPASPSPPRVRKFQIRVDRPGRELPHFTEKAKSVPTAEVLHRIAQTAGWSMTLVGSPKEHIDIDVKDADPREALRQVLKQSGAMGVLKRDKLVVVATPDAGGAAGMLIEKTDSRRHVRTGEYRGIVKGGRHNSRDVVRVFQGDITVHQGEIVQGDVVCVGGSVELEPGSVVQGDTVAVGGGITVSEGALLMGQAV